MVLLKSEVANDGGDRLVGELNLGPRVRLIVKLNLPLLVCFLVDGVWQQLE